MMHCAPVEGRSTGRGKRRRVAFAVRHFGKTAARMARRPGMLRSIARHLDVTTAFVAGEEGEAAWEYGGDVGEERFEFGELEWCLAVAEHGCKLLEAAAAAGKLDLSAFNWGFSEEYCQCPERLAERFDEGRSVYWFMIH
eukprot:COSAG06_NODE_29821_length_550_cov_0.574279_1_plen_139_part_10